MIVSKTLSISAENVYDSSGVYITVNNTEYTINSTTKTDISIPVGTEVTINCDSAYVTINSSSNTEYIPTGSVFPITFIMPNEDLSFTIYDDNSPF